MKTADSAFATALAMLAGLAPAAASQPVPGAMAGCIAAGRFISDSGYVIRVRPALQAPDVDWRDYEGRHVLIEHGYLLPSDIYVSKGPYRSGRSCVAPR